MNSNQKDPIAVRPHTGQTVASKHGGDKEKDPKPSKLEPTICIVVGTLCLSVVIGCQAPDLRLPLIDAMKLILIAYIQKPGQGGKRNL